MTYPDNPAGRLYAVLQEARTVRQDESAAKGWSQVFGIRYPEDSGLLMSQAAEVVRLSALTRERVGSFPDEDPELILEHFPEVERTLDNFQAVVSMDMRQFLSQLTGTGDQSLKLCASLLHRRAREPTLDESTVEDLLNQVRALLDEVLNTADLDAPTKTWLTDRLQEVERALVEVRIRGFTGVDEATDRLVGGLRRRPHRLDRIRQSHLVVTFITVVTALDVALNAATNLQKPTTGAPSPSPVVVELQIETGIAPDAAHPQIGQHAIE